MYKVFIVEDEIVIREGIKNKIHWEDEGFIIVGDESDGELAYPMIIKEQPDILITDIKMPFMDGLELSKLLKKEMPQLKIIIISGYSDFGYAQKAIDIGVSEYLLKPITSDKLVTAVKNAASAIEKERKDKQILEQYQLLVYQKQGEKRTDFFNALVSGKMSLSQIIEQEKELGIDMVARAYCVMLFQFKGQEDMYEYSNEIVQCETRMTQALNRYPDIKVFERGMDGWAFILMGENDLQIKELTKELCNLLIDICGNKTHYFGGIGRVVHRIRDMQQSYLDANSAFSLRYFESRDQFLSYNDVRNIKAQVGNRISVSELNLEKLDRDLLEEFLKRGTINDVDEFVDSYFDGFGSNAMKSTIFRHYIIMDGYSAIVKFLNTLKYPKEKIDTILKDMNNIIDHLSSFDDCCKFYKSILKEAIDLRNKNSQKRYASLIERAKEYMHLNYSMSDLTLDQVAATVNLSPNYFSSLFNHETGMTFIEYLTDIRMEKAKDYLRCSSKKISEIGFLVGYLDSHYFSYIFKKTQNCTPSEYRMQGKGEE
ncbi:response regulator [Ruminiclostridium herbifermentans]|uniref:Stage 0 sporulation protein A homolog n=1 Tax=Ruminiclostridium herbifermentans TaxID=2488810 RepID=A0A4U7JGD6_9FIRM|nr:response regulator [Ruminiclostridium herbifermentans]QNU67035.1 response regulator [Ruminiclostridium herbifermentans]